jgi:hypothetical protein
LVRERRRRQLAAAQMQMPLHPQCPERLAVPDTGRVRVHVHAQLLVVRVARAGQKHLRALVVAVGLPRQVNLFQVTLTAKQAT